MTIHYLPSNRQLDNENVIPKRFQIAKLAQLLVISSLFLMWSCGSEPSTKAPTAIDTQPLAQQGYAQLASNRPFSFSDDLPGETFTIDNPSTSTVLTTKSGTVLTIPANAIVDADGTPIRTAVTIRYREFREAAEIISSGIPMTIKQTDGTEAWMQTAGMFEIQGFQNGQAVAMAEGQSIKVDFVSDVAGDYDAWVLDKESGNWVNLGPGSTPEEMELGEGIATALAEEIEQLKQQTAQAPENPVYEKQNELKIEGPIDLNKFPELKNSRPLVFAYAGTDKEKAPMNNTWIRNKDWSRYELAATAEKGRYELTLLAEDTIFTLLVKKALKGDDLAAGKARYQALMATYQADLVRLKDKEMLLSQQRAFRRSILAKGFNIYNYDILWKNKAAIPLLADFKFEALPDALASAITVYFITQENKVVVELPQHNWNAFRFDPRLDNKLIAVLPDNQVALFTQSDFNAKSAELKAASGKEYTFQMKVKKEPIQKLNDLKEVIKMASL